MNGGSNGSKRARSESIMEGNSDSNNNNHNNNNNNMNNNNNNNNNDSSSESTTTPPRDPVLEAEMDRLGVEEDFRVSLRCMSPNSRTEVLNDIARNKQAELTQRMFMSSRLLPTMLFEDVLPGRRGGDGVPNIFTNNINMNNNNNNNITGATALPLPFSMLIPPLRPHPRHTTTNNNNNNNNNNADNHNTDNNNNNNNNNNSQSRHSPVASDGDDVSSDSINERSENNTTLHHRLLQAQLAQLAGSIDIFNIIHEMLAQRSLGMTRDIDDMSYEELLELQERIGYVSKGISREQISQCLHNVARPSEGSCVVCQSDWNESSTSTDNNNNNNNNNNTDNNNTNNNNNNEERAVALNTCQHIFHFRCIQRWLEANKACPVCKQDVV